MNLNNNNINNDLVNTTPPDINKLIIATHNVHSLTKPPKQHSLLHYMELSNFDIFGVSETSLTFKEAKYFSLHNEPLFNGSFKYFFHSDKQRHLGSGVGLIFKSNIAKHIFNHEGYFGRILCIDLHNKEKQILRIIQIYLYADDI